MVNFLKELGSHRMAQIRGAVKDVWQHTVDSIPLSTFDANLRARLHSPVEEQYRVIAMGKVGSLITTGGIRVGKGVANYISNHYVRTLLNDGSISMRDWILNMDTDYEFDREHNYFDMIGPPLFPEVGETLITPPDQGQLADQGQLIPSGMSLPVKVGIGVFGATALVVGGTAYARSRKKNPAPKPMKTNTKIAIGTGGAVGLLGLVYILTRKPVDVSGAVPITDVTDGSFVTDDSFKVKLDDDRWGRSMITEDMLRAGTKKDRLEEATQVPSKYVDKTFGNGRVKLIMNERHSDGSTSQTEEEVDIEIVDTEGGFELDDNEEILDLYTDLITQDEEGNIIIEVTPKEGEVLEDEQGGVSTIDFIERDFDRLKADSVNLKTPSDADWEYNSYHKIYFKRYPLKYLKTISGELVNQSNDYILVPEFAENPKNHMNTIDSFEGRLAYNRSYLLAPGEQVYFKVPPKTIMGKHSAKVLTSIKILHPNASWEQLNAKTQERMLDADKIQGTDHVSHFKNN